MHGLVAMERINSSPSVWHEFLNILGILNMGVPKEFADHLLGLQKDPDQYFVEALFHAYKNNQALVDILHNLSHPPTKPLESFGIGYFSNPGSYKYHYQGKRLNIQIVPDKPPESLSKLHEKQTPRTFSKTILVQMYHSFS